MPIRCPECSNVISPDGFCGTDGCLTPVDGVWRLMTLAFYKELLPFLRGFEAMREQEGYRIKDTSLYSRMPFDSNYPPIFGDTFRQLERDLGWIHKRLPKRPVKVLNYGSWNGWLSHQLAEHQHEVTAISYFIDSYDGLAAKKYFPTDWRAIQMNIEDLQIMDENFDVIIMNRGISYLTQPLMIVRRLMEKLTSSGLLLITGLNVYSNPISRQKTLADRAARYRRLYGVELFPFPTRGYLDQDDLSGLKQLGISLDACRYGLSNLRSFFRPSRPRCYRGWYQKS